MKSGIRAGILGVGSAVPTRVLSNADLERMVDTSDEWISTRTGIKERRISEPTERTSDYATKAALKAMERAGIDPLELELIIVATLTPDKFCPPTACIVQDRIGARNAAAFDLSAACSGFVYALDVAARGIEAGAYRRVLVIGADLLSHVTDYTDRSTCVLFGDGAGAAVVGPVERRYPVHLFGCRWKRRRQADGAGREESSGGAKLLRGREKLHTHGGQRGI